MCTLIRRLSEQLRFIFGYVVVITYQKFDIVALCTIARVCIVCVCVVCVCVCVCVCACVCP